LVQFRCVAWSCRRGHVESGLDAIMILLPDTEQKAVYDRRSPRTSPTATPLFFAHGFNIRFDRIMPPAGRRCRAWPPRRARATCVRRDLHRGRRRALPHRRRAGRHGPCRDRRPWPTADAIGGAARRQSSRPPSPRRPRPTSSASRPCCAAASPRSSRPDSRPSPRPGYQPEIAYFECLHELKLIVDLMYEGGIAEHALLDLRHRRVRRCRRGPASSPRRPRPR